MNRFDLRDVSTAELRELADEIERGTFATTISKARLAAVHLEHLWERVRAYTPLGAQALKAILDAVLAERETNVGDEVQLVWSGPEGKSGWAQPTASALADLFQSAQRDVLVAGYTFDHGADLLADLHTAMRDRAVATDIFLHVAPAPPDQDDERHLRAQVADFFARNWPFGEPYPRLYVAPHTLNSRARGNLHAKCVVVDGRHSLVGSANFTQRGHERNIEVGVRVTSSRFARSVVAQFHAAASEGVFVPMAATRGSGEKASE